MKKLNNKGITLIELIVSFAIVSVAMVYFYQTLYTVRKLYVTAQTETQAFVDKDYAIRIVNEYIDQKGTDGLDGVCTLYNLKYLKEDSCTGIDFDESNGEIKIKWNLKTVSFYKKNKVVATQVPILKYTNKMKNNNYKFFDGTITKNSVRTIRFVTNTNIPNDVKGYWHANASGSGDVVAYYYNHESGAGYNLVFGGDGGVWLPEDSSYLFYYFKQLESIDFENAHADNVNDMSSMFRECYYLKEVKNLGKANVSNVKKMNTMFYNCFWLNKLNLNDFKTDNLEEMMGMFTKCGHLSYVDLSSFNTAKLTNMSQLFYECKNLSKIYINGENFIFNDAINVGYMFYSANSLDKIKIFVCSEENKRFLESKYSSLEIVISEELME